MVVMFDEDHQRGGEKVDREFKIIPRNAIEMTNNEIISAVDIPLVKW